MTTMRVVGECFFWYRLTRVFPDKFHRAVKRLCVHYVVTFMTELVHYIRLMAFFSRTTGVSRQQKGKPFWVSMKQTMRSWQWHQLDHMQIICTFLQTTTSVPHQSSFFTGQMLFLPSNQQRQSTEDLTKNYFYKNHEILFTIGSLLSTKCNKILWPELCLDICGGACCFTDPWLASERVISPSLHPLTPSVLPVQSSFKIWSAGNAPHPYTTVPT